MNSLLDNGLFAAIWVGCMWGVDALIGGDGTTTFPALMLGAGLLIVMGLVKAFLERRKVF